ncbi:MAG: hypothetical protein ACRDZ4_21600 [Egibacteraceae bacterium]
MGSNPLPNYLAACALRPERVLLVYSEETKRPKERLEATLRERLGVEVPVGRDGSRCVPNAAEASAVEKISRELPADARLNYTGGTKIMATHARVAFKEAGGTPDRASYVDGARGIVRFDDGYPLALPDDCLDLDVVRQLHGLEPLSEWEPAEGGPSERDAVAVADAALDPELKAPELPEQLYRWTRDDKGEERRPKDLRDDPIHPGAFGLDLPDPIPGDGWTNKQIERWRDFLGGVWLDVWARQQVQAALPAARVHAGVHVLRHNGRDFEVDVVAIGGHQVRVVSCTTDRTLGLCKGKGFEVQARARQLGGDLASAALVCFLSDERVGKVARDLESVWDEPNRPAVFGLSHLREWHAGDRHSLTRWATR